MNKSEFIKKLNLPITPMSTWLENYRFSRFYNGNQLIISQEFIDEFESYITKKAKKDYRAKQFFKCVDIAKELLTTP